MTPQASPQHHRIEIRYGATPPGQTGARPRVIPRNHTFEFTSSDAGTLSLEFIDHSPMPGGGMIAGAGQVLQAANPGHYLVICRLTRPDGQVIVLDPRTPGVNGGGELEVTPGE
jgi:hypothetical protein